ncbi:ATP-binding protein [Marinobacter sp. X15-166B]|uniref:ATP-binding protein n=1 Tax=Marinobacter sp. X15-166B TaxID=1897620 RepID=UPI00085BE19F|nr:ATP-binding protein [Marinobacter sp. X15-166B]OEY66877.1 two-component sensor histidine kinase [Marinobacter sp. X15-166B]
MTATPKAFLNLYARLAVLVAFVLALSLGVFWGINSVRLQAWNEHYPAPLMRWLASMPSPESRYQWLSDYYDFTVLDAPAGGLSRRVQERLGYGQVVALENSLGLRVLVQARNGDIQGMLFRSVYRDVAESIALITLWHLNEVPEAAREHVLAELSRALQVGLVTVRDDAMIPPAAVLQRVSERGLAFYRDSAGHGRVLMRLDDGTLVHQAVPAPFNPWSLPVVALSVILAALSVALLLYLALRILDRNLQAAESVAARIARGDLSARMEAQPADLVYRLAAAFNGMAEHIQRLVGVQREMIHAVSHELRTPVARIRFGVQMIESSNSPETLHRQLEGIDGDIQELDELIDEILTYARLEQGGPVFALVESSVADIVRQVVAEQQQVKPGIAIRADFAGEAAQGALAEVEPRYLHRAIQNLVGNAARYAESEVRVRCRLDAENCRIDVEDDGAGIPEADWEKVFTAFSRLDDSRTRTSGGYGLGLSIVRRILYWHNGQAFVGRSDALGGAQFSLVWPRRQGGAAG